MTSLNFDELHILVNAALKVQTEDELVETIRSLLINAYERAVEDMNEEFEYLYLNYPEMLGIALEKPIEGKTWEDRIRSWYHGRNPNEASESEGEPDAEAIQKVTETECHRMYNTGAYDTACAMARDGRTVYKRWCTMLDEKVRDTHDYLEGDLQSLDSAFFTFDGDSAMYPGGFTLPQNNVNCRCYLEYETA